MCPPPSLRAGTSSHFYGQRWNWQLPSIQAFSAALRLESGSKPPLGHSTGADHGRGHNRMLTYSRHLFSCLVFYHGQQGRPARVAFSRGSLPLRALTRPKPPQQLADQVLSSHNKAGEPHLANSSLNLSPSKETGSLICKADLSMGQETTGKQVDAGDRKMRT